MLSESDRVDHTVLEGVFTTFGEADYVARLTIFYQQEKYVDRAIRDSPKLRALEGTVNAAHIGYFGTHTTNNFRDKTEAKAFTQYVLGLEAQEETVLSTYLPAHCIVGTIRQLVQIGYPTYAELKTKNSNHFPAIINTKSFWSVNLDTERVVRELTWLKMMTKYFLQAPVVIFQKHPQSFLRLAHFYAAMTKNGEVIGY